MLALEELYTLVSPQELERLSVRYAVDAHNQVKLPGTAVFVCLLNGKINHPELTQRLLEDTYAAQTGRHADHSSFGKRLSTIPSAYFEALFSHLRKALQGYSPKDTTDATDILRLRFIDATIVSLSAKLLSFGLLRSHGKRVGRGADQTKTLCQRREVKGIFALEEGLPALLHVCHDQREANDSPALGDAMIVRAHENDLFVFDTGMWDRKRLLALHQAGAFFLTPHSTQALRPHAVIFATQEPLPTKAPADGEAPYRLVRVESAHFENKNEAGHPTSLQEMVLLVLSGVRFDPRTDTWKPLVLLTNLPLSAEGTHAGPFLLAEIPHLYKRRWDIETFFKFLKQRLGYEHLTSRCENGIRVMLYVTLIAALVLIWYKRKSQIDRGWRSVQFWLAHDLQEWTKASLEHAFTPT